MFRSILLALALSLSLCQISLADTAQVDLNTATAEQLAEVLIGIGPSKAQAIVEYRERNGGFTHIDELVNVRGIGLHTVDQNRSRLLIDGKPSKVD